MERIPTTSNISEKLQRKAKKSDSKIVRSVLLVTVSCLSIFQLPFHRASDSLQIPEEAPTMKGDGSTLGSYRTSNHVGGNMVSPDPSEINAFLDELAALPMETENRYASVAEVVHLQSLDTFLDALAALPMEAENRYASVAEVEHLQSMDAFLDELAALPIEAENRYASVAEVEHLQSMDAFLDELAALPIEAENRYPSVAEVEHLSESAKANKSAKNPRLISPARSNGELFL